MMRLPNRDIRKFSFALIDYFFLEKYVYGVFLSNRGGFITSKIRTMQSTLRRKYVYEKTHQRFGIVLTLASS